MKSITFRPTEGSLAAIKLLMDDRRCNQSEAINGALVGAIAAKVSPINLGEDRTSPPPEQAVEAPDEIDSGLNLVAASKTPKFRTRVDPAKIDAFQRQMARKK